MLGNNLSGSDPRALNISMQLFGLDDPIVGIEGILATERADLVLLMVTALVNNMVTCMFIGVLLGECTYLNLLTRLRY